MTQTPETLDEEQVNAKWAELAPLIDRMMQRVGTPGEFPVGDGSSIRGDDKAANPYQVSHVIRQCLNAGVDHLHAVKVIVVDRGLLHVAAPSSLARGALENLATAYWVIGPTRRADRVERALRWHAQNFKDQHKALDPLALVGSTARETKLKKLDVVAAKHGVDAKVVRRGYTSTEAVTYAEANAPGADLGVVLPWQICSGFAHGRPWAYLGVSKREEKASDEPDIKHLQLTSELAMALYPTLAAMRLLQELLRLYQKRAHALLA